MPIAPIAMAPASERPPMIVSAGYFSSRRAPNFQSSHETPVRPAFIRSAPPVGTCWRVFFRVACNFTLQSYLRQRLRRGFGGCSLTVNEQFYWPATIALRAEDASGRSEPRGEVAPNDRRHRTKLRSICSTRSALAAANAFVAQIALALKILQI